MKNLKRLLPGFFILCIVISCNERKPQFNAPLLKNIGTYKVNATTPSAYALQFFNQGIIMANGFNQGEAERSFREAIRIDSTFAMAYWGIAYVLGPNYNSETNIGGVNEIKESVKKAMEFGKDVSSWEKALIDALVIKFPPDSDITDGTGYSEAMKTVYGEFPSNDFVASLYAESIMNLHAWDMYSKKGGEPRPWTSEIINVLEHALAINPENPLANHLYMHALEAGPEVEKALAGAERLKHLVPCAGHLVHMPSHIYINTGDYHEGSLANENAVIADSIYIMECKVQGLYPQLYYPHNYHFLAATAALEGRGSRSIEAAFKTAGIIEKKYLKMPGYETVLHYTTIPYHVLVKFAQWEKILALPIPEEDLKYPVAIWHYARGMAYANLGKITEAENEMQRLKKIGSSKELTDLKIWGINSSSEICSIALLVLKAEIYLTKNKWMEAEDLYRKAMIIEDNLSYNEPPDWFFSVRHSLGEVLLKSGNYKEAEKIYSEDLETWPKNGYALNGLYYSLKFQNRADEAVEIKKQFTESWKYADTELLYSRVDPEKRKDLTLSIGKDSPVELASIAAPICMIK